MKTAFLILLIIVGYKGVSQETISKSEYVKKGDTVYYKHSLYTGTAIKKAPNGTIIAEEHYENGIAHGLWKEWYSTGEKKFEGKFYHGKNDGEWIQWSENGAIQRKLIFDKGTLKER